MLKELGFESLDALIDAAVPGTVRSLDALRLPTAATEHEVLDELRLLAASNEVLEPMIGLGYYGTITPGVIRRNVLESPSWYTAYTPYQPEISQGRLEALLNFQTMVSDLTGLDTANASLLDEAHGGGRSGHVDASAPQGRFQPCCRGRRLLPPDAGGPEDPPGSARHRGRGHGPRPRAAGRVICSASSRSTQDVRGGSAISPPSLRRRMVAAHWSPWLPISWLSRC